MVAITLSKSMKKYTTLIVFFTVVNSFSQSPAYLIIEKLPLVDWSGNEKGADLTNQERLEHLKILPDGERIEFVMDYDEEEDTTYWEFEPSGLYYLDLDFDGDLDLLYSATNGTMRQTATKVFYNRNNELEYHTSLRDGILDIKKDKDSYTVFTLFRPCCDSYTTRIDQYKFSAKNMAVFEESISLIGRSYYPYKGMLDFSSKNIGLIENSSIYALRTDFRGGYFRERNKEVKKKIKEYGIIELISLEGKIKVVILGQTTFKEENYFLVITETLSNLPRMPISLYEWSEGDGRRLVGWVKEEDLE